MSNERSGNSISVLLSGNYNNFVCNRSLPDGATDEQYQAEFDKAIELADYGLRKRSKMSDIQNMFLELADEYRFIQKYFSPREENQSPPREEDMDEGEKLMWQRLNEMDSMLADHKDSWDWDMLLRKHETADNESPF